MPSPRTRPLIDWLIWIPSGFYAAIFAEQLLSPARTGDPGMSLVVLVMFLLIGAANECQSKRISRLEAKLAQRE